MQEFFEFTKSVGFPIAVAGYLLFRFEKKLENADKAITGKDGVIDKIDTLIQTFTGRDGISDKIKALTDAINNKNGKGK
jgi:hypothetical protein